MLKYCPLLEKERVDSETHLFKKIFCREGECEFFNDTEGKCYIRSISWDLRDILLEIKAHNAREGNK